jgi:hypothetical protein
MVSVAMPMNHAHERYSGRPSCPKCGILVIAPEVSEYESSGDIRHTWSCRECDYEFQTLIALRRRRSAREKLSRPAA